MDTDQPEGPPSCVFDSDTLVIQVDIVIPSKVEAISSVVDRLMNLLRRTCCSSEREFAVETVLREALANAIIHGNRRDSKKSVRVCCACDAKGDVLIVVTDDGEGFNPMAIPSPLIGQNILSDHGRGIYLINLLADQVHFERGGTEIHIRMGNRGRQQPA